MLRIITLSGNIDITEKKKLIYLIKDVADHEEIKKSEKHSKALAAVIDLLKNPSPKAWHLSSDSDVLRCPICLMRVPGDNHYRNGDKVEPMNLFCYHADSIYELFDFYVCPFCGAELQVRAKNKLKEKELFNGEKLKGEDGEVILEYRKFLKDE